MNNGSSSVLTFGVMILFLAVMYFMMIRPQKKKEKADQEMRASLKVGDEIITIGGVVGKVEKINENSVVISTTTAKTKMEFLKTAIASVTAKSTVKSSGSKQTKAKAEEVEEEKAPSRDKKVTPKKLGKKEDKADSDTAEKEAKEAAE